MVCGRAINVIHPAYMMAFDQLFAGLEAACASGMVRRKDDISTGRSLYCYTERCVYDNGWDEFALVARGLILHPAEQRIVAVPFPKFFNVNERAASIPNMPFETFEKLDGSLIIIHHYDNKWRTATKGAFDSSQAVWAETKLNQQDVSTLIPGYTYLAEAIYPENRVVIHYSQPALVLLGGYTSNGMELEFDELCKVARNLSWRTAQRHSYTSFSELVADAAALPATQEGFVIRFADGYRLKVKGAEYRRIHSLISRCTPLAMWEAMAADDDMEKIRRDLPEEFWQDFDNIIQNLTAKISNLTTRIKIEAEKAAHLSDKELGLSLASLPDDVKQFLFPFRKANGKLEGKTRATLFRTIRPTGNFLEGYTPSYAINRIAEEDA
jgi:RNA ligase